MTTLTSHFLNSFLLTFANKSFLCEEMKALSRLKIYFLVSMLVMVFSCKDKFEQVPKGSVTAYYSRYFPLDSGRYIIYDVDSIVHHDGDDNTLKPDSLKTYYNFQVKEQTDSSFIDGEGRKAWYVSRYKRLSDT